MTPKRLTLSLLAAITLLAAGAVRLIESMPEPDPAVRFICPQWDSVRIRGITRSSCGDTSAVTAGYLR